MSTLGWITLIVELLHILGGISWFGGYIFMDFVLWPAIWRLPASEGQSVQEKAFKRAAPLYTAVGPSVVVLGLIRGTFLGPIQSFSFLFGNAYGITWLCALILAISLMVWGALWHKYGLEPIWKDGQVRPVVLKRLKGGFIYEMSCFGAILCCMVLMGFGL